MLRMILYHYTVVLIVNNICLFHLMSSSMFVKKEDIYMSIYDWLYICWLLMTTDPCNKRNKNTNKS